MAEDILHSRHVELSSNNLDFDQNILMKLSIKYCGFTLPLNFNLNATINAEYIRETNYNHSRISQIIQDEYRLNPEQKNVYDIIL